MNKPARPARKGERRKPVAGKPAALMDTGTQRPSDWEEARANRHTKRMRPDGTGNRESQPAGAEPTEENQYQPGAARHSGNSEHRNSESGTRKGGTHMKTFTRLYPDRADDCYLVRIDRWTSSVYYGHIIPGHENKAATAVMDIEYFNTLVKRGNIIGMEAVL